MRRGAKRTVIRKPKALPQQIHITDIQLNAGDMLYKNEQPYAEVVDESDSLYFLKRLKSDMPDPYQKGRLIELILSGQLTVDQVKYKTQEIGD